jgi:hypothetical protein
MREDLVAFNSNLDIAETEVIILKAMQFMSLNPEYEGSDCLSDSDDLSKGILLYKYKFKVHDKQSIDKDFSFIAS